MPFCHRKDVQMKLEALAHEAVLWVACIGRRIPTMHLRGPR